MSDKNQEFISAFHSCIFHLRNNPAQCKEAVDLLKTHMKYHPLDEAMLYEYMIVGFYAKEKVDDIIVQVLNNKNCRISECLSNYKFYDTMIVPIQKFEYTTREDFYYSSTPSLIQCPKYLQLEFGPDVAYILNQRFVNYKIVNLKDYSYEREPRHPLTFNRRLLLDKNFKVLNSQRFQGNLEDIRLFDFEGQIYFSSCFLGHRDEKWGVSICVGKYPSQIIFSENSESESEKSKDKGKGKQKAKKKLTITTEPEKIKKFPCIDFDLLTSVKNENVEKNWVYFSYIPPDEENENGKEEGDGNRKLNEERNEEENAEISEKKEQLCMIYQWYPLIIGRINKETKKQIVISGNEYGKEETRDCYNLDFIDSVEMPFFFKHARGSTNCHRFGDENWFIVHIVSYEVPRHYYNVIAVFDLEMNLLKYSYPFKLSKEPIEYALGLIVNEDEVIISYSTWDNTSNIGIYRKDYIDSMLKYE